MDQSTHVAPPSERAGKRSVPGAMARSGIEFASRAAKLENGLIAKLNQDTWRRVQFYLGDTLYWNILLWHLD